MRSSLKLVIQDSYAKCKILPITFRGSVHAWYNNLESGSITSFNDLRTILVVGFSTKIILIKKSSMKLYRITLGDDKSTQAYMKRINEKILKVEELLKTMAKNPL